MFSFLFYIRCSQCAGDTPEAVACVKELLRACNIKEVNAKSAENGQTALHMAAYKCHFNVLRALLDETNTDIWVLDDQKRTALHWATEACMYTDRYNYHLLIL